MEMFWSAKVSNWFVKFQQLILSISLSSNYSATDNIDFESQIPESFWLSKSDKILLIF